MAKATRTTYSCPNPPSVAFRLHTTQKYLGSACLLSNNDAILFGESNMGKSPSNRFSRLPELANPFRYYPGFYLEDLKPYLAEDGSLKVHFVFDLYSPDFASTLTSRVKPALSSSCTHLSMLDGAFSDLCLICEWQRFYCHKSVLAAMSPVFRTMFLSGFKESTTNEVKIDDMRPEVLGLLLRRIYGDRETFALSDADEVGELFAAADKYDLGPEVKCEALERMFDKLLGVESVVELALLAEEYAREDLEDRAVAFICKNLSKVRKSTGWTVLKKGQQKARGVELMERVLVAMAAKIKNE
jgi:hypothetical protein